MRLFRYDDHPIRTIDVFPIAAVVLVAAVIILVAALPRPTHNMRFDIGGKPQRHASAAEVSYNTVSVDTQNRVLWNDVPIDLRTLRDYLDVSRTLMPEPELRIAPHRHARYSTVASMLVVVKRAGLANIRFTGNGRYVRYEALASPKRVCPATAC